MTQYKGQNGNNHGFSRHANNQPVRSWSPPAQFFGEPVVQLFFARPNNDDMRQERATIIDMLKAHDGGEFILPNNIRDERNLVVNFGAPTTKKENGESHYRLPQALLMEHVEGVGGLVQFEIAEEYWRDEYGNEHLVLVGDENGYALPWERATSKRPRDMMNEGGVRVLFRTNIPMGQSQTVSVLHIEKRLGGVPWNPRPCMTIYAHTLRVSTTKDGIRILEKNQSNPIADLPGFENMLKTAQDKLRDVGFYLFYLAKDPPKSTVATMHDDPHSNGSTQPVVIPPDADTATTETTPPPAPSEKPARRGNTRQDDDDGRFEDGNPAGFDRANNARRPRR